MNPYDQHPFDIRCEWGPQGVATLAPISDVVIIVDVLSFTTCVDIVVGQGAVVYPYVGSYEDAANYATSLGGILADKRGTTGHYSLSPASLTTIPAGARLILPSPNGSTLSLGTGATPTLAGCLRNAEAVARAAQRLGRTIAVIPAGERWRTDGSLRPSFEDWVGAGAIISYLNGILSPEAHSAVTLFRAVEPHLSTLLADCSSGRELIQKNHAEDVALAGAYNASSTAPILQQGGYFAL